MEHVLPLLVAIPLAGGFLMPLVGKALGRRRSVAALPILIAVGILVLTLVLIFKAPGPVTSWMGGWRFPLGISLVADGLSKLVLLVVATVSLVALVFSMDYMNRYTGPGLYYGLFLLMLADALTSGIISAEGVRTEGGHGAVPCLAPRCPPLGPGPDFGHALRGADKGLRGIRAVPAGLFGLSP